jgi:hypothetical protein
MRHHLWQHKRFRLVDLRALLAALFCLAASAAYGQQGPLVSLGPSDTQASTSLCATAPAVNATQAAGTCTINVNANQHLYINYLQVGVCGDNAAVVANTPQLAFTSTNLNGWTQQFSFLQGATAGTTGIFISCQFIGGVKSHPLVSAAGPVSVTIVPPAQQAHSSYPINVEGYFAQ